MVTVPERAMLRVRTNQELDSRHTQPGTVFDAVVLNDVVADSLVAIPRGATVQGTVVESRSAGALKGRGELGLQLTHVILAGRVYPITSDIWSNAGGDETARTVNSALGLGAVGAIIGGVAGAEPAPQSEPESVEQREWARPPRRRADRPTFRPKPS